MSLSFDCPSFVNKIPRYFNSSALGNNSSLTLSGHSTIFRLRTMILSLEVLFLAPFVLYSWNKLFHACGSVWSLVGRVRSKSEEAEKWFQTWSNVWLCVWGKKKKKYYFTICIFSTGACLKLQVQCSDLIGQICLFACYKIEKSSLVWKNKCHRFLSEITPWLWAAP